MEKRKKLQYRTRNNGERTSLGFVLASNGFSAIGTEGAWEEKKVLVISTQDKTYSFEEKKDTKNLEVKLSMILANEFRIKREIKDISVGYIANYPSYMTTEGLKVGCQKITFDALERIYKAMNSMKDNMKGDGYIDL